MPNPMTGDFEAVVQLAVGQLNGLLATLHQNGLSAESPLRLLHNARVRVGERRTTPDVGAFGDWVIAFEGAMAPGPKPPLPDSLVAVAPPGTAKRLLATFGELGPVADPTPPDLVRGTATVQMSTPRLNIAEGAVSEIGVLVDVRAVYTPDPSTTPLPPVIHGRVRAAFDVRTRVSGGVTRLLIQASPQNHKIEFIPAPGSTIGAADVDRITVQVRGMVREGLRLLPLDLPPGFPFSTFKGVGSGSAAAIALPLQISGAPPVPGGAITITQSIVGSHGFAFGVSGSHVLAMLAPQIDSIRTQVANQPVAVTLLGETITYELLFSDGPTLTFTPGGIEISGTVSANTTTTAAPDGSIAFKAVVSLELDPASRDVRVVRVGATSASVSLLLKAFLSDGRAGALIDDQIDAALPAISSSIAPLFEEARTTLDAALQMLEGSASASYAQAEVTPAGIIVRGDISSAPRLGPILSFDQTPGGGFSAFESWIPGGWIDSYTWSWIEHAHPAAFLGEAKVLPPKGDTFLLQEPSAHHVSRVCLRVSGARFLPDGRLQSVTAGTICEIDEPVIALDAPSWWETMMVPVWKPDVAPDARLSDAIVAHVSVQTDRPRPDGADGTVVFFPDWTSRAPLDVMARGLESMQRRTALPAVLIIVPDGAFLATRREFEARLAPFPAPIAARVQVAEDLGGGWTRTFEVSRTPAVFLLNARRRFVWHQSGELHPGEIAAALDRHAVPARTRRLTPTRVRVAVGERAPDVVFTDDRGDERALHRLRGRPVITTFWQAASAPCLVELGRLQRLLEAHPRTAPFIVGFHGGPAPIDFDAIRKSLALSFPLVQDSEHRAARTFGVRCWPTTVEIDPAGRVAGIQLGIRPERDDTGYGDWLEPGE